MNTTEAGRKAESVVSNYLKSLGHTIKDQNWRTRWCEIDIVSIKKKCVYFTEVKYRSQSSWGSGLDYITEKKLKQMKFAAEFWIAEHDWRDAAMLQAAEVNIDDTISLVEL